MSFCSRSFACCIGVEYTSTGCVCLLVPNLRILPHATAPAILRRCFSFPQFRPLSFDYENDSHASQVEDQLMLGDSVMIAPVLTQNATGRYVYLPEEMKLLRLRSATDYDEEVLPKGHHYVSCQLDEALLFIRPDKLIPVSRGGENEQEVDFENVDTIGFVKTEASYRYYCDDGVSTDYDLEKNTRLITQNA